KSATRHANKHGFGSVQEFIKETLRDKLFPPEELSKDEMAYVMAVLKDTKENNDFISEKELFNELDQKIGIYDKRKQKVSKRNKPIK
ncbi:hypothetical protein HOA92_07185, partial [archaeon]|nr:hypothetical protein [archaeon]MBT6762796.1 hypothetical protein [archaeon]